MKRSRFYFLPRTLALLLTLTLIPPGPAGVYPELSRGALRPEGVDDPDSPARSALTATLTAGMEENVLVSENQLPPSVRVAQQQLMDSCRPEANLPTVMQQSSPVRERKQRGFSYGIIHLQPGRPGLSQPYLIPPPVRELVREAIFPPEVTADQVVGLLGFHVGRLQRPPEGWALLYLYAGKTYLRVMENGKVSEEEIPPSNQIGKTLANRTRALRGWNLFERFIDALELPRGASEALELARFLLQNGKVRVRSSTVGSSMQGKHHVLGNIFFRIPEEHGRQGDGTRLNVSTFPASPDLWALVAPEGATPQNVAGLPWILVHRDPAAPTPQLQLIDPSGAMETLAPLHSTQIPGISLVRSARFRQFLSFLEKQWQGRVITASKRNPTFSLGDRILLGFRSMSDMRLIRRTGEVDSEEGEQNVKVFLFENNHPLLATPVGGVIARPFLEAPEMTLGEAFEQQGSQGLPIPVPWVIRFEREALVGLSIPFEDPAQLQCRLRGDPQPILSLKTFIGPSSRRESAKNYFGLHIVLHLAARLSQWSGADPKPKALAQAVAGSGVLDRLDTPNWGQVTVHYRFVFWKDAQRTPWVIRADEEELFRRQVNLDEVAQVIRSEDILQPNASAGMEEENLPSDPSRAAFSEVLRFLMRESGRIQELNFFEGPGKEFSDAVDFHSESYLPEGFDFSDIFMGRAESYLGGLENARQRTYRILVTTEEETGRLHVSITANPSAGLEESVEEKLEQVKRIYDQIMEQAAEEGLLIKKGRGYFAATQEAGVFFPSNLNDAYEILRGILQPGQRLVDLGGGDARIAVLAALLGASGISVEQTAWVNGLARAALGRLRGIVPVENIAVVEQDFFDYGELKKADLIWYYVGSQIGIGLGPVEGKILAEARPGTWVVLYGLRSSQELAIAFLGLQLVLEKSRPKKGIWVFQVPVSAGMEEGISSFAVERTVASADKFLTRHPEAVVDADLGLFGMGDPRMTTARKEVESLLGKPIKAGTIQIPAGEKTAPLELNLADLWELICGRRERLEITGPAGEVVPIGPAQLVLVETGQRPFLVAELKVADPKRAGGYTIENEPVPEGSYRVAVQLASADGGRSGGGLQVYLPRTFFEPEPPLPSEDLAALILEEAAVEVAHRVVGASTASAVRQKLERPEKIRRTQEEELTNRLRTGALNRPTESGIGSVLVHLPYRIIEFLELLDELSKLYDEGLISLNEELQPYAQEILPIIVNSLAAVLVKNRIPVEALRSMGTSQGLVGYTMEKDKRSLFWGAYGNDPARIGIARGLLTREEANAATVFPWKVFKNLAKSNDRLRDLSDKDLSKFYWKMNRYKSLRSEHAHLLDFGLMKIGGVADTAMREYLSEYQDLLEHLTLWWSETVSEDEQARPISPEEITTFRAEIENMTQPHPEDTEQHRLAGEMISRVAPHLLDWVSRERLPAGDFAQLLLWFKLLLLTAAHPLEIELGAVRSASVQEFFSFSEEWLRHRTQELLSQAEKKPPLQAGVLYLRQLLRELDWVRKYFATAGQMTSQPQTTGLEEFETRLDLSKLPINSTPTAGMEEGELLSDAEISEPARAARQRLREYLTMPGRTVWDQGTVPMRTSSRREQTYGVLALSPRKWREAEQYLIPLETGDFVRQAILPDDVTANDALGVVGFHLGADNRPDLLQPPAACALLYRRGGEVYLWVQDSQGLAWEERMPSWGEPRPVGKAMKSRRRSLGLIPTYQMFSDRLKFPRSPQDARNLAQFLLEQGLAQQRPSVAGGNKSALGMNSLRRVRIAVPEEFTPSGGGTPVAIFVEGPQEGQNAQWALVMPGDQLPNVNLDDTPWLLVHRNPRSTDSFEVIAPDLSMEVLPTTLPSKSNLGFVSLVGSPAFRSMIAGFNKCWNAQEKPGGTYNSFSLRDTILIGFRSNDPLTLVQRTRLMDPRQGSDNEVLCIPPEGGAIGRPLQQAVQDPVLLAQLAQGRLGVTLGEALLKAPAGVPLAPTWIRTMEQEALCWTRMPYQDPDVPGTESVQFFVHGRADPLFGIRSYGDRTQKFFYNANAILHSLSQLGNVPLQGPAAAAARSLLQSLQASGVLRVMPEPQWAKVTGHYLLALWNDDPTRTPWIIRVEEQAEMFQDLQAQGLDAARVTLVRTKDLSAFAAGMEEVKRMSPEEFVGRYPEQAGVAREISGATDFLVMPENAAVHIYRPAPLAAGLEEFVNAGLRKLPPNFVRIILQEIPQRAEDVQVPGVAVLDAMLPDPPYSLIVPKIRHYNGRPFEHSLPKLVAIAVLNRLDAATVQLLTIWEFESRGRRYRVLAVQA